MKSLCGIDCGTCPMNTQCAGCAETGGKPFGGTCMLVGCERMTDGCAECGGACALKERIIAEFNALGIADMGTVTDLNALAGFYINLEYTLPSGVKAKFWDDKRTYLGNQIEIKGTDKCYGIIADEHYLMVCRYGENGASPELIVYKQYR